LRLRRGNSRQLFGLTIATERHEHRMAETWHPLGVTGIIFGVQFPGRGLGMECSAGTGLRQQHRLETVGEDASYRLATEALFGRALSVSRPMAARHPTGCQPC